MKSTKTEDYQLLNETIEHSRRNFLQRAGTATLSGTALALIGGISTARVAHASDAEVGKDVRILNTAVAAEYEAIAAYGVGAKSGLLKPDVLKVAVNFQSQHKTHADALSKAVKSLGGTPDEPKGDYNFPVSKLKSQKDVLQFAAGLERGAMSAYIGAIPLFEHRELSGAAAGILADESMHWAVLRYALGLDPVPAATYS